VIWLLRLVAIDEDLLMATAELIRIDLAQCRKIALSLITVVASLAVVWLMTPEQRYVALPALAAIIIGLVSLVILRNRDGVFPFFEIGTLTIMATLAYTLIPLLGYLASGLTWNALSDSRLYTLNATPKEVGAIAWRYVVYFLGFAMVYVIRRGNISALRSPLRDPDRQVVVSMVKLIGILLIYFLGIMVVYEYNYWHSYQELEKTEAALKQMPLLIQQVSAHLFGVFNLLKLGMIIFLLARWHQKRYRYILYIWLVAELVFTVAIMGARTNLALLLLAVPLVYHRLVKPFKLSTAALLGCLLLIAVLLFGFARDFSRSETELPVSANVLDLRTAQGLLAMNNEFQVLFGNAFHMKYMKESNSLGKIPTAMYFNDLVRGIPQQFLPYEKVEGSGWYLERIGLSNRGIGMMFGGITQSILGWDWLELVLRGAALGFIFALVHRWYVRRSSSFWMTLLYLWLCLFCYYTVRDTTFSFVWVTVQRFVILIALVKLATMVFSAGRRVAMAQVK
jgi:hypothetical protein